MLEKIPETQVATARFEAPSAWLRHHAVHFSGAGMILDLACGSGRHARWLVAQGYKVLAVDRDESAIDSLRQVPGLTVRCADLESASWPLAGQLFSGIVVARYLHRPRLPDLAALLAPGGVLIYETFMQGNEVYGSPRRAEFLLAPGELRRFAEDNSLELIDYREGFEAAPRAALTQSICCRRPN